MWKRREKTKTNYKVPSKLQLNTPGRIEIILIIIIVVVGFAIFLFIWNIWQIQQGKNFMKDTKIISSVRRDENLVTRF